VDASPQIRTLILSEFTSDKIFCGCCVLQDWLSSMATNIMSGATNQAVGYSYNECFIGATDIEQSGVDGITENYFICRTECAEVSSKILEVHESHYGSEFATASTLLIDSVLISSYHKYIIYMREEFWHFLFNTLIVIAAIHKVNPQAVFVLVTGPIEIKADEAPKNNKQKLVTFLLDFFLKNKISYYMIPSVDFPKTYSNVNSASDVHGSLKVKPPNGRVYNYLVYKAKNVTVVDTSETITNTITTKDVKNLVNSYINSEELDNIKANKKVYITRGNREVEPEPFVQNKDLSVGYKSSKARIYEEDLLEQYLEAQGFEIVDFNTLPEIQDQINLMHATSVLVGATGTGLINTLFMQDKRVLIELKVEEGSGENTHGMNPQYTYYSSAKDHLYIGIDAIDKQARTAIEKLKVLFANLDLDTLSRDLTEINQN